MLPSLFELRNTVTNGENAGKKYIFYHSADRMFFYLDGPFTYFVRFAGSPTHLEVEGEKGYSFHCNLQSNC